jgi:hypothetical protein
LLQINILTSPKEINMHTFRRPDNGKRANGVVLWRGPSLLDGQPIVVVATLKSRNIKTGDMVQTWIIPDPEHGSVVKALTDGRDKSVCGSCPRRPAVAKTNNLTPCYVEVGKAPNQVGKGVDRGIYPDAMADDARTAGEDRAVRIGAYGDPAAVPTHVWADLAIRARVWTGYTHQWRKCDPMLKHFTMASADSLADAKEAWAMGWRTFRALEPGEKHDPETEILCPSDRTTCERCGLCSGTDLPTKSIAIPSH